MATGIVSVAAYLLGWRPIAYALVAVNLLAYPALWALTLTRAVAYRQRFLADVVDHARGSGFFTTIAGTNVLGAQLFIVLGWRSTAEGLFVLGVLLWFVVMYTFFTSIIVRRKKPTLVEGINGAWLIATVATESVAILAVLLRTPLGLPAQGVAFCALVFYLIGCNLYLAIITLIFYRFTFLRVDIVNLTPPYWINMGAVAITTLAGALLVLDAQHSPLIAEITPFVKGFTLFFWSAATWWIPLLLFLGVWRHVIRRFPLRYDPQFWGMVFPLGMYTASTYRLAHALDLPWLEALPRGFLWLAVAAWLATFAGLLHRLARIVVPAATDAGRA
ncbi:MAG: tellurite resistance/C4-dicarboxylate transporter family protein [Myxococcales bacterium]|nr:tellurite resistance/C4-dicarboxylate transporter family protein [Myxococcales bacterium]